MSSQSPSLGEDDDVAAEALTIRGPRILPPPPPPPFLRSHFESHLEVEEDEVLARFINAVSGLDFPMMNECAPKASPQLPSPLPPPSLPVTQSDAFWSTPRRHDVDNR